MQTIEEKKALRSKCLATRLAISTEEKAVADLQILNTVCAHPAFRDADCVLLFAPVRGEVDLMPLLPLCKELGKAVAFPRCEGDNMTFHTVQSHLDLQPDRYHIPAPATSAPLAPISQKTLCILPGLAAGRDGSRLGYGGGFYDRFLDTFPGVTLFPVYNRLLFPTLVSEPTDKKADVIITEKGEILQHV